MPLVPTSVTIVYVDSVFMNKRLSWLLHNPENEVIIRTLLDDGSAAWVLRPEASQVNAIDKVFLAVAQCSGASPRHCGQGSTSLSDLARLFDVLDVVRSLVSRELATDSGTPAIESPQASGWQTERREVAIAAQLLHDALDTQWTLTGLAAAVNLSPSHLVALFRSNLGSPPMSYLMELRLQRFSFLLATTSLTVAEAALKSGWRDSSYAGRVFRRRFGLSPSRYRASNTNLVGSRATITPQTTGRSAGSLGLSDGIGNIRVSRAVTNA
jgi:AraC-type DNA-binding domain-containing proteins